MPYPLAFGQFLRGLFWCFWVVVFFGIFGVVFCWILTFFALIFWFFRGFFSDCFQSDIFNFLVPFGTPFSCLFSFLFLFLLRRKSGLFLAENPPIFFNGFAIFGLLKVAFFGFSTDDFLLKSVLSSANCGQNFFGAFFHCKAVIFFCFLVG